MSETRFMREIDGHRFTRTEHGTLHVKFRNGDQDWECIADDFGLEWFNKDGVPLSASWSDDLAVRARGFRVLLKSEGF